MRFRSQIKQLLIFLSSVVISLFFLLLIVIINRFSEEDVFSDGRLGSYRTIIERLPEVIQTSRIPEVSQTSMIPKASPRKDTSTINNPEPGTRDSIHVFYYIIVGSFTDPTQARQKADKMQNDLHDTIIILPPSDKGYIRISKGKYTTFEEALSASKEIKKNVNPDAWILSIK